MKRVSIRSTLFNIAFFALSAVLSFVYIPAILLSHKTFVKWIRFYLRCVYILERLILGLKYEIRGQEFLPHTPPYIIGAKHQSAYETLKLHLLFDDPAIILKRELLKIPLWGIYLKKSKPISIDRTNAESAVKSINDGAQKVTEQKRPIVIFPQGTRVKPEQTAKEKPYKVGIVRIQENTNLPIIPMATNAGLFWPRNGWGKSKGTVIFEFLPPIMPGRDRSETLKSLETALEEKSNALMEEARAINQKQKSRWLSIIITTCILAILGYGGLWLGTAKLIEKHYTSSFFMNTSNIERIASQPTITGFPKRMHIHVDQEQWTSPIGSAIIKDIHISGWPLPLTFMDTDFKTGTVTINDQNWPEPLMFKKTTGRIYPSWKHITVKNAFAKYGDTKLRIKGHISFQNRTPDIDLMLRTTNHIYMMDDLVTKDFIKKKAADFIKIGLELYRKGDHLFIPITHKNGIVYAGVVAIYRFDLNKTVTTQIIKRAKPLIPSRIQDQSQQLVSPTEPGVPSLPSQ